MRGKTFIISGPSGVGKSTVLSALLEKRKNLYFSVSATTRDPRPGELDGIHYHFMDAESFRKWIAMDQFLEYAEYVGNFYGTPKRFVDEETVRLRSHVAQLRTMLESDEPMGRKMDFLIQEVNRESNTIGSKCCDVAIAQVVVGLKAEVEKMREQVQNVE